ncbi:hypothetical protein [Cryobacterium sp. HLT2-28]|uniref:hypothetical protein n=1 Tax=Cryobacterium sp. HLT2-28 TaxID=1259146 RepID=UPI001F5405A7|nr:hypothetical protein [Cryobacterium sp. HLT2-28]
MLRAACSVLRATGLVTERRDSNRILYSFVGDRLALSVGDFLSTVCPEQMLLRGLRPGAETSVRPAAAEVTPWGSRCPPWPRPSNVAG